MWGMLKRTLAFHSGEESYVPFGAEHITSASWLFLFFPGESSLAPDQFVGHSGYPLEAGRQIARTRLGFSQVAPRLFAFPPPAIAPPVQLPPPRLQNALRFFLIQLFS